MITFIPGGLDLSQYVMDGSYEVSRSPQTESSSGGFVNWDGTIINADKTGGGFKVTLAVKLEEIPDDVAAQADSVFKSAEIDTKYTSPGLSSAVFRCTSYNCTPDDAGFDGKDPVWNISVTLEADNADISAGSGSL